tara:strand:+ start:403 stop:711 length:309 start_codon:yes stop_codon:yes gene_type:complete
MATTASLLETYIVDLTRASEEEGDDHSTQTTTIISACIEILLRSEDDPTITHDFPFDGDHWTKKIEARALVIAQRQTPTTTILWITISTIIGITAYAIGAGI